MERGDPMPESTECGWWEVVLCLPDSLLAPLWMITAVWELLAVGVWKFESMLDIGEDVESVIRSDSSEGSRWSCNDVVRPCHVLYHTSPSVITKCSSPVSIRKFDLYLSWTQSILRASVPLSYDIYFENNILISIRFHKDLRIGCIV